MMTHTFNVVPLVSVGQTKFGTSRTAIRKTLGTDFTEFRKSRFSKNTTDDFHYMHIFYNEKDECIAVELFDCRIIVNGTELPADQSHFNQWLLEQDNLAEITESYSTSKKLSLGMSASENHVESILFGAPGYYA